VLGCARGLRPAPSIDAAGDLLAQARARPTAARVTGRFSLVLVSPGLSGDHRVSTGGAVILDRPGRGHLAVLGPLGGPVATLQSDGSGVAVALSRGHEHYVAQDAEAVLRETTGGGLGLDDLFGLFVGDVPLDGAKVLRRQALPDGAEVVLEGPQGSRVTVGLARDATPRRLLAANRDGVVQIDASWAPFALLDEAAVPTLVPTAMTLKLPPLGIDATVTMKSWTIPDPVPDVFGLAPPSGFTSSPLEDVLGRAGVDALGALLDPEP
jgi:hypothetical protein